MKVSKTLVKLVDETIVPAVLVVGAKVLGVFWVNRFLNLPFEIRGHFLFIFPQISYPTHQVYQIANSYSSLIAYSVVFLGVVWVLLRAHFFHFSHLPPARHTRLLRLRLGNLVAETFEIYQQAAVWFVFLWLATAVLILQSFSGAVFSWLWLVVLLVSVNLTWLFLIDIEKEIEHVPTHYLEESHG